MAKSIQNQKVKEEIKAKHKYDSNQYLPWITKERGNFHQVKVGLEDDIKEEEEWTVHNLTLIDTSNSLVTTSEGLKPMGLDTQPEEHSQIFKQTKKKLKKNALRDQMKDTKFNKGPEKQNLSMVHTMVMDMLRNQKF